MSNPTQHPNAHRPSAANRTASRRQPQNIQSRASSQGTLISRRKFLYGAAGVGALAVAGVGVAAYSAASGTSDEVAYLKVPESSVTSLAELDVIDNAEDMVSPIAEHEIPYGTLVWVNDDSMAACLLPTETGSPLTQIGVLALGSGDMTTVREKAVGADEHFEIYDVRGTSEGLIWTEANVLEGTWRVYASRVEAGAADNPLLLEEGDATYETPTLGISGNRVFWQVIPKQPNEQGLPSRLMGATIGKNDAGCVYESARRMGTPPYSADGSIVITPRVDSPTVYYQLTNIDAKTGEVTDQMTLPASMSPLEAAYGATGFAFSFPDIYNYGDGISNLGTYTPLEKPAGGDYGSAKWFAFARTPTAAPAWCGNLLIVKSSYSVCGVDLKARTYFAIDVDDGADTYGEYLASSGTHGTFVTYTNIDHSPVGAEATHACRVKVWKPV